MYITCTPNVTRKHVTENFFLTISKLAASKYMYMHVDTHLSGWQLLKR